MSLEGGGGAAEVNSYGGWKAEDLTEFWLYDMYEE
jgi:hypothetical protein